jgi:dihydropteroate synthase
LENLKKASFSLNCKGRLFLFDDVVLMGILNATPDSFYDGGRYNQLNMAVEHTAKMLAEGAHIIDVGGASSRPGAAILSPQEEAARVVPLIEKLKHTFKDILISIDTYQSDVAKAALDAGASIVNDISGGKLDEKMFALVAQEKCPYVLTHIKGNPTNMQDQAVYEDVVLDVLKELSEKVAQLEQLGVNDIIIDPGFGFGKTIAQNYTLLRNLRLFEKALGKPILAGLSRKSMLYKPLGIQPEYSLNATTATNILALQNGARILRIHDVKEAKEAVAIFELYQG